MFLKKTLVYTSVSAFPLVSVSNILQTLWHTSIITTCIICKDFDQTAATISCISEWYLPVLLWRCRLHRLNRLVLKIGFRIPVVSYWSVFICGIVNINQLPAAIVSASCIPNLAWVSDRLPALAVPLFSTAKYSEPLANCGRNTGEWITRLTGVPNTFAPFLSLLLVSVLFLLLRTVVFLLLALSLCLLV